MNTRRLEHFRELLHRERARTLGELERLSVVVTTAAPGDDGEAGAAGPSCEDDAAVLARETAALEALDVAIRTLNESPRDYGICASCGRPISDERLELLPATRVCGRASSAG
jgi:RNA polymerase-binding transcription factor DksA